MRGLAEYTMLGRRQAIIVVLLCGFLPMLYIVSAAVVALVNLRKGLAEGLLILLWAILPAIGNWMMGDPIPLFLMPAVVVLAQLLRRTQSWQNVLLGAVVLGIIMQSSLQLMPGYIDQWEQLLEQAIGTQAAQSEEIGMNAREFASALLSFFGAYYALIAIIAMVLARWWQALLYNPGGFREEFHRLRIRPVTAALLLALIVIGMAGTTPINQWVNILCVAPMISGLAMMHGLIGLKNLPGQWLVPVYLALFFLAQALIVAGLVDSVLDVRKRVAANSNTRDNE